MKIGDKERATQDRVVKLLRDLPGYTYLGNWEEQPRTSPIEDELLRKYLTRQQYPPAVIAEAIRKLHLVADNQTVSLYERNKAVYQLLRYGVEVKPEAGKPDVTVKLVRWDAPAENYYGVAQEVTVPGGPGGHGKRPDVVLYLNGLAVGVLELKRSTVSVQEGIRQNLDNQKKLFIEHFFSTVQLVMAGNDTEGLRYGTVGTEATYYLEWLEGNAEPAHDLDKHLAQLCNRERLLSLLYDFVIFDRGTKKLCRPNQYFGVLAAREFAARKEGGVIFHTQGSGKSLTMVWMAKWLLETRPQARVLLLTDRDELDEQIEKVFKGERNHLPHQKRQGPGAAAAPGRAPAAVLTGTQVWAAQGRGGVRGISARAGGGPGRRGVSGEGRNLGDGGRVPPHAVGQAARRHEKAAGRGRDVHRLHGDAAAEN